MSDTNYTDAQLAIVHDACVLLKRADDAGLVLEIDLVSVPPLAMGNYVPVVRVRKTRAVYTEEAACRNH